MKGNFTGWRKVFQNSLEVSVGKPWHKRRVFRVRSSESCERTTNTKLYSVGQLAILLLLAASLAIPLRAQIDTGRISGVVTDQSGGVVPGATVNLTNEGTGLALVMKTGATGYYMFPANKAGTYRVEIEAPGFAKFVQSGIPLQIQQDVVVNAILQPGSLTQTIRVTAAPSQLQTQDASVGQTVGTTMVDELPLNGRNWLLLTNVTVGVTYSFANGGASRFEFSANGHPADYNDYRLNGFDNNEEVWSWPSPWISQPPPDAIEEFKIIVGNYSAEFGRGGAAIVDAVTKSGTNKIHGDVWEFVRNDKFDAAQFFENSTGMPKGAYRQNQFGGTLGGPVFIPHVYDGRNKTFFFVDYEGLRIRQAGTNIDTVPTSSMIQSGYTNLQDLITYQTGTRTDDLGRTFPLGTVFDPATTRQVTAGQADPVTNLPAQTSGFVRDPFYQGSLVGITNFTSSGIKTNLNLLPAGRLDPNGVKLLGLYPTPNQSGFTNDYAYSPTMGYTTSHYDGRVDHNFAAKDQLSVVGSWHHLVIDYPGLYPGMGADGTNGNGSGRFLSHLASVSMSETHLFSPTLINEARIGMHRYDLYYGPHDGNTLGIPAQYGIQGIPQIPGNGGLPYMSFAGLTAMGVYPWRPTIMNEQAWELLDNLSKVHGAHTLKGGFQGDMISYPMIQPSYPKGEFVFGGTYTEVPNTSGGGTGLAQLLLTPTGSSVPGGFANVGGANAVYASHWGQSNYVQSYYSGYFQDDWKATGKLTLNLGARWDYYTPYYDRFGNNANFVPGPPGNGAEYVIPQRTCNAPRSASFNALLQTDGIAIVCSSNFDLTNASNHNFVPRIGLAYQFTPRLVARAGYGMFYGGMLSRGYGDDPGGNYPFVYNFIYNSPDAAHPITYSNGSLGTLDNGLAGIQLSNAMAVNAKGLSLYGRQVNQPDPYYDNYNFSLQYQLTHNQTFQLAYVGNQGHHMNLKFGENAPSVILPPGLNPQNYVPFPDFARGASYYNNSGSSYYNSLQASFERRLSNGFTFLGNYTFSKCRNDYRSTVWETLGSYRAPLLPGFGVQGDYSLCDSDVPNLFHLSGLYALPFGKGMRFLDHSSAAVNQVLGGWHVNWNLNLEDGFPFTVTCPVSTTADFGCNALLVPGQNIYGGAHNVNDWLNASAFATPPAATSVGQSNFAPLGGAPTQAHGPGQHRLDFSMMKEFPITESTRLQFRAECFNLTNTPFFSNPSTLDYTNTKTFGKITTLWDGANDPREIQFALKLYW